MAEPGVNEELSTVHLRIQENVLTFKHAVKNTRGRSWKDVTKKHIFITSFHLILYSVFEFILD